MAGFLIDLNLCGPLRSIHEVKQEVRSSAERRVLYVATEAGSNPGGNNVSYIGITQQKDMGARFTSHHKLVHGSAASFDQIWVGYPYRLKDPDTPARSHDARLKALEDILISWFLPPHNEAGIDRNGNQAIGCGAYFSAQVHFHWWTLSETERRTPGIPGFPKQINYSVNQTAGARHDHVEAIW